MIETAHLRVARISGEAHLTLQCDPADAPALGLAGGVTLGSDILRATRSGAWHALHLGPDEWLLIGPAAEGEVLSVRLAGTPLDKSVVDVASRTLALAIEGQDAALLLNAGCPLDLSEPALPAGGCSRTVFGKVPVLVWRTAAHAFRIEYGHSYDDYVTGLLGIAAQDLAGPVSEGRLA